MPERKFLTVSETALACGMHKRTVQTLIADGVLPVVRFTDRLVRVPVAALDDLARGAIAAATTTAPASAEAS